MPNVMGGYLDNPEANAVAFVDGWFRTGDQGVLDRDGYLTITGRLKEIINRGGEKVAPTEVEEALLGHSDVAPARKMDPGELFPWPKLSEIGIGIFPSSDKDASVQVSEDTFASMLASYGYGVQPDVDIPLSTVVTAFQRHFRPERVDGIIDMDLQALLSALLSLMNS